MKDFIKEIPRFTTVENMSFTLEDIKGCNLPFVRNIYNVHGYNFEYHNIQNHITFKRRIGDLETVIQQELNKYFNELDVSTFKQDYLGTSVLYLKGGRSIPLHTDDQYDNGIFRSVGILLYMTTHETGGELCFPFQKRIIKPEAGKLLIFPSLYTHPHFVTPTNGEDRYALRFNYGMQNEQVH